MSDKKKLVYVVDTKDQKRHSRNCTVKESPGLYEEPDVLSSSEDELEDENEQVIKAVYRRQPLWDNRMSKTERNAAIMSTLWADVDEELGLLPGKSKLKWTTLRHKFSSERRKVELGTESTWKYYPILLFLMSTRQPKQNSSMVASPNTSAPKTVIPKMSTPKKKKGETQRSSNNKNEYGESTELVPVSNKGRIRAAQESFYPVSMANTTDDRRKRENSVSSSDSEVDVVEEINMSNGSFLQRQFENPISYKRVCIRRMQETQLKNIDDEEEDDEIRRFCSYLEVMLRKMPKRHQEMFCEETLDHLASVNRKLRRSNI